MNGWTGYRHGILSHQGMLPVVDGYGYVQEAGKHVKIPQIGTVAGKGLVAGVACVIPGQKDPDGDLAWEVVERSVEKGLLMFSPVGFGGATVKISPPLVISEAAILESVSVLEEAFTEAAGRKGAAA